MNKPSDYHKQGYTCGEAIIKKYNEEHGTDIPISLGSGMGTGFTVASMCGAIGAASIIIGYKRGRSSSDESNEARAVNRNLMKSINDEFNTIICKDLKKNKVNCGSIIDYTYESLKNVLEENDK